MLQKILFWSEYLTNIISKYKKVRSWKETRNKWIKGSIKKNLANSLLKENHGNFGVGKQYSTVHN